eukprot:264290_1
MMAELSDSSSSEDRHNYKHIVMDNGSLYTKLGFSGSDAPQHIFETAVISKVTDSKDKTCVGNKLKSYKHNKDITITYPIQQKMVTNSADMTTIYDHAFDQELGIEPEEYKVMLTEPALNSKSNRETLTEVMFETFNIKGMYVAIASVCGLYATGRTSGVVIDSGYENTQLVPIWEGYGLPHATRNFPIAGKHCSQYLKKLITQNSKYDNVLHLDDMRVMKETFCYIAKQGIKHEMQKPVCDDSGFLITSFLRNIDSGYKNYTTIDIENICDQYLGYVYDIIRKRNKYKLPDGNVIELVDEQFKCSEILFRPRLFGQEFDGLDTSLVDVLQLCDRDIREDIIGNAVLCGGNAMLNGFKDRLINELNKSDNINFQVKICSLKDSSHSAWIGGSILAELQTSQPMFITPADYASFGSGIVHRKCF